MSDIRLPVGTKIRFLQTLETGPTGDHPALLFARKGQTGEVTGHNDNEGHWVKTDDWATPFGATYKVEFEVIQG